MADKEAFLIIVSVDEPAGNAIGAARLNLAGLGFEYVHPVDLHLHLIAVRDDLDVGFTEHHEQVPGAGVLQIIRHVQVGVHPGPEYLQRPQLVQVGTLGRE